MVHALYEREPSYTCSRWIMNIGGILSSREQELKAQIYIFKYERNAFPWLIILLLNFWLGNLYLVQSFSQSVLLFIYFIGISVFDVNILTIGTKVINFPLFSSFSKQNIGKIVFLLPKIQRV